jgi:hypothetical protein
LVAVLVPFLPAAAMAATSLTSGTIHLVGVELVIELPEEVATTQTLVLPRGTRALLGTKLLRSGVDASEDPGFADSQVRARLIGPDIADPNGVVLIAVPGDAIDIGPHGLSGNYTLSDIELVDAQGNRVVSATPSEVPIRVIDQVAVSAVTTRQLSLDEIREHGVVIGEDNFTAYEFTVGIQTLSNLVPLKFDIAFARDEAEDGGGGMAFVPVGAPGLNIPNLDVQGIVLAVPPEAFDFPVQSIPGAIVIPGNIGFLHDYFQVLLLVSNVAPEGSQLNICRPKADRYWLRPSS